MGAPPFKMANLARPKESLNPKSIGKITPSPYSPDHRIALDQTALDSLGMQTPPKVGDTFHAMGHAEVTSVSAHDNGAGDKSTRVELQFKKLGLRKKAPGAGMLGAVNSGIQEAQDE